MKRGVKGGIIKLLSRGEILDIHLSAIEVLEEKGVKSKSKKILEIFRNCGAEVDFDTGYVRIPQHLVEGALRKSPSKVILHGRSEQYSILLENARVYFGFGGTPTPYIRDLETGGIRRPTKKDFAEATRLGDALPNMDFIMSIAGVFDVPPESEYLHEFEAMFNNTVKPIVYSAPSAYLARRVMEMAAIVLGGFYELRRKPILALYSETVSPLTFAQENEAMIEFANENIPIVLGPVPMAGATAPITVGGATVVAVAEALAAITLIQSVKPGVPVIYSGCAALMDQRTGRFSYGAPEFALGNIVLAQMAQYYGLPCFGWGGCSDSKVPDAQAGAEVMMNTLVSAFSGINLIHDFGYLAGGSIGSMEMAVIGDEVAGIVKRILKGVRIDDESLAVDLIKNIGPEGQFMSQKHTLKFLRREVYTPTLFDRKPESLWLSEGGRDIAVIAREKAKKILKEHVVEPLPEDIRKSLSDFVKKCEKELINNK
ncbi:MAG: trimethylamine methyltransferase family protein [Candidatus Methanomethylicia archaeon]